MHVSELRQFICLLTSVSSKWDKVMGQVGMYTAMNVLASSMIHYKQLKRCRIMSINPGSVHFQLVPGSEGRKASF